MKTLLFALALCPQLLLANSGADLLMSETGAGASDAPKTVLTKSVHLDDPFLVLLYGNWKARTNLPYEVNSWLDVVFEKKFEEASHLLTTMRAKAPSDFMLNVEATELYLYWKLGLAQTFFDRWVDLAAEKNFLGHPMGVALDQIVGLTASRWFMDHGIQVRPDQKLKLELIKSSTSKFNVSAQAWAALRTGAKAEEALARLPESDPLRFFLAQTIVLQNAREGKMKVAASFLKRVMEPVVARSKNTDEVVKYHLLLARLLYQAGALDASAHYYSLVPESSRFFLESRVERLWIYLRKNDMPKMKGDLKSLDLALFEETFLPEVYLNSSIAHLKLCEFGEVKRSFDSFIATQKKWRSVIQKNLGAEEPSVVDTTDPYLVFTANALRSQGEEAKVLERLSQESIEAIVPSVGIQPHWVHAKNALLRTTDLTKKVRIAEIKKRWTNKLKIQDEAIRKMRFVKIELLSLMHRLAQESQSGEDKVTTYQAAQRKSNELEFPYDGLTWGDEVFHLTAQVKNLCLARKK